MTDTSGLHHELAALRAELDRPSRAGSSRTSDSAAGTTGGADDEAGRSFMAEWEEPLKEWSEALSEYAGNAEDLIAAHPLASVLTAFVLGIAVGRMVGRT